MTMTSPNDVTTVGSPFLVGKTLHMHSKVMLTHPCIHWHPCQLFLTTISAMQKLSHQFCIPISEPVTYRRDSYRSNYRPKYGQDNHREQKYRSESREILEIIIETIQGKGLDEVEI